VNLSKASALQAGTLACTHEAPIVIYYLPACDKEPTQRKLPAHQAACAFLPLEDSAGSGIFLQAKTAWLVRCLARSTTENPMGAVPPSDMLQGRRGQHCLTQKQCITKHIVNHA
jgi:hypothetical protein